MLGTSLPVRISVPFASSAGAGYINPIPIPSQIVGGSDPGLASMSDGFPPRTFIPEGSGGLPPRGQDFNGILNLHSSALQWASLGCGYVYDATFQAAIGGYPKGAIIPRSDLSGEWVSTTDNNTTNPESFGAGWLPTTDLGLVNITVGGSSVTLTPLQAANGIIRLNGTLTANINLIFPNWPGMQWTVINNITRNAFRVTAKMATGAVVAMSPVGASLIYCNGTDLINNAWQVGIATDPGQAVRLGQFTSDFGSSSGWKKSPDGAIEQWGQFTASGSGYSSISFPIVFPNTCRTVTGNVISSTSALEAFKHNSMAASGFNGAAVNASGYVASVVNWRATGY